MELQKELQQTLDQALETQCRAAGALMRKHFRKSLTVTKKADGSRVTNVDLAIADWIVEQLPSYPVNLELFTEETQNRSWSGKKPVLIVDELDGTSYYIAKKRGFAHQTALWWPGEGLVCGMIYYPLADVLLKAWRGESVQIIEKGVVRKPVAASPSEFALLKHYHTKRYRGSKYRDLFARLGIRPEQLVYTHAERTWEVLEGKVDTILSLMSHIHPWDWAGEKVILEAAGWTYAYLDGQPLDPFRAPAPDNLGYLACPTPWFSQISDMILKELSA